MSKTKEQQAQEYAEKQLTNICLMLDYEENKQIGYFHTYDIQKAYSDGYTAAEQSMWRSVEDELPGDNILVVVWIFGSTVLTDFCEDGKWHYSNVRFWMRIPSLPDANTEKK